MRCRNNGSCFLPFFTIQLILWWSSFLFPYVLVSPHRTLPQSPQTKKTVDVSEIQLLFQQQYGKYHRFQKDFVHYGSFSQWVSEPTTISKTLPGNPRVVCLQVGRWKPRSDLERENMWKNWVDVCMRRNFISDAWTCVFLTQLISVCCLTEHFL